jgi:nucleoside-diphosphate-sugar epimerase
LTRGPWLVTGASGFLGRQVLQIMQADRGLPRALAVVRDRQAWDAMDWTRGLDRVAVHEGPVTTPVKVPEISGIFHLAALVRHSRQHSQDVYRTNIDGTLAMVRLAAGAHCRLVFVSTSGTVGCFREPGAIADEDSPHCDAEVARWPYYDSKVKAEVAARRLADELGVDLVIARPPVLLGPGDHRFRSVAHVTRFLEGKVPFVIRGGMHFADVRDVAAALVRIMGLPHARPVYHLPGTMCSIEEFYGMTAAVSGRKPPSLVIPYGPALALSRLSARLGLHLLPEPSLVEMAAHYWAMRSKYAEEELKWRPRPGLETLRDTVEWVRSHPKARK